MQPEMPYKHCKFRKNCTRDTPQQCVNIWKFSKIFNFGVLYPYLCTDGG